MKKANTRLPSSVWIGPIKYKVDVQNAVDLALRSRLGEIDFTTECISVLPTMSPGKTADTLLHEVLHGVCNLFALFDDDDDKEERVVQCLATGLINVMKDNPEFMGKLQKLLK